MKIKESTFEISLVITIVIYSIFILIFSVITFEDSDDVNFNGVYLEFSQFEKKVFQKKKHENITRKLKPKIYFTNIDKNIIVDTIQISKPTIPTEILDSNLTTEIDTLKYYTNLMDSLVVNFPNLIALKSAMAEHIKKKSQIETDSAMVVGRMRKYILDYYKFKYPTPLSKFGDGNPGIPIDKILDLFSRDDTVDVKRIKKYLGLDKN